MAILILLAFGILLLLFALIFRGKNLKGYHSIMSHNKNVQPLLKERSAVVKHEALLSAFEGNPAALHELIKLQTDFADKLIDAATYEAALDELAVKYKSK